MIKKIIMMAIVSFALACGNNANDADLKDPNTVHPETEAVPDSMQIQNDSLIAPDTSNSR